MIRINNNYLKLKGSYLFAEVSNRVKKYSAENPDKRVIRLGIGDVTEPLTDSVIKGLEQGVKEMSKKETFQGYPPYEGFDFLRKNIALIDFKDRNIDIAYEEIYVSTGAKEDTANFQELFAGDVKIAITDPVYPVYLDSNVMAGRTGDFNDGRYDNIVYLDCTEKNNFTPDIPEDKVDLIYLCFPNNPTGQTATKEYLSKWVKYARDNKALILYDAAYEAYIRDPKLPRSIFEIPGAKECSVEFRSLSKTAGFTGTRCAYTIIPKELSIYDGKGGKYNLAELWVRRESTKFNGVCYIIQKGAAAVFTKKGQEEVKKTTDFYLGNAEVIRSGLDKLGIKYSGGVDSPYIWLKTPGKLSSWEFFDKLLNDCQVVGTPGAGFGKCGEGYFRLTSFGSRENTEEAIKRLSKLKI